MTSLAGAAVALVILVDLATGQGPPIYTNYLQAQNYRGPPPPPQNVYPQRVEYNPRQPDKELEKAIELGKVEESPKEHHGLDKKLEKAFEKDHEKNHEKDLEKSEGKEYGKKDDKEGTQTAGVLSSLSNSMSDAWNRFSTLGRSTREVKVEATEENASVKNETTDRATNVTKQSDGPASSKRGIDSYEYLQQRQSGYIYFKVPKYLVCNY